MFVGGLIGYVIDCNSGVGFDYFDFIIVIFGGKLGVLFFVGIVGGMVSLELSLLDGCWCVVMFCDVNCFNKDL